MTIEQELAELTNNFTENDVAVRCWTKNEKFNAIEIFKKHYDIVECSDGRRGDDEEMSWIITAANPKKEQIVSEALNEAEDIDEVDLDPEDEFDLQDLDLDSIDDSTDVDDAEQLTILKTRAADLAKKWKDTYKQISELAKKLDLVAAHNDDLEISLEKASGKKVDVEKDLNILDKTFADENAATEEIDDTFGPSEYDDRAALLPPDTKVEEFKPEIAEKQATKANYPWNKNNGTIDLGISEDPNELKISPEDIDDDF